MSKLNKKKHTKNEHTNKYANMKSKVERKSGGKKD